MGLRLGGKRQQQDKSPLLTSRREFPSVADTVEMANLSALVYDLFHEQDCESAAPLIPPQYKCLLYQHDTKRLGTQVLVLEENNNKSTTNNKNQDSNRPPKLFVVFAGTDDVKTCLDDGEILLKNFGPLDPHGRSTLLPNNTKLARQAKVHKGFDDSLFGNDIYANVRQVLEQHLAKPPNTRQPQPQHRQQIYLTGHSLGAAESVLLGVALAADPLSTKPKLHLINFGCPKVGNHAFHTLVQQEFPALDVWRLVLGKDLVPRLPAMPFHHVGHTVQLGKNKTTTTERIAYYQHQGNTTLGYAGVPMGWSVVPYIWVPSAVGSHHLQKYMDYLSSLQQVERHDTASSLSLSSSSSSLLVVDQFASVHDDTPTDSDDDDDGYFWDDDDIIHPNLAIQ